MEPIDVAKELGLDSAEQARSKAKADAMVPSANKPRAAKRVFVAREIAFPVEFHDAYTDEVTESVSVTSRVPDGGEEAQIVRYATQLAGVPMDSLSHDDRDWFRAIARCEIQIRAVSGTGFKSDSAPSDRLALFFNRLWSDPDLLARVHGRLVEHGARFRVGDPGEGEGSPRYARVVVASLWPSDAGPATK